MFPVVLNIITKSLSSTSRVGRIILETKPVNLEENLYTIYNKVDAEKIRIVSRDQAYEMDALIARSCFKYFLSDDLSFSEKEYENFEKTLYSRDEQSREQLLDYLKVAKDLGADKELYFVSLTRSYCLGDPSEKILKRLHVIFGGIDNFPDKDYLEFYLGDLPDYPGHHPLFEDPSVVEEYRKRLFHHPLPEEKREFINEYLERVSKK